MKPFAKAADPERRKNFIIKQLRLMALLLKNLIFRRSKKFNEVLYLKMNKFQIIIVQILLSAIAFAYVSYQLIHFNNWPSISKQFLASTTQFIFLIGFQMLLISLNILSEAYKWKILVSPITKLTISKSIIHILKGIQLGMVTPARAGDPFAKAMFFPKYTKIKAIVLSYTGSMIQNFIILVSGIVAVVILKTFNAEASQVIDSFQKGLFYYGTITFLIVIATFFILNLTTTLFKNVKPIKKIKSYILTIKKLGITKLLVIAAITIIRYCVFCLQFWLFLNFWDIISYNINILFIPLYFAIITFIPSAAIADLGIRSSVALFLFGLFSPQSAGIVISVFLLWCLNLAIPAIIASFINIKQSPELNVNSE